MTKTVPTSANFDYPVQEKFAELVSRLGRQLDPLGHEAWMPKETK